MTEISFHFNVPDRTSYACRLLRKAVRQGSNVVVTAPPDELARFDLALWTFDPIEFVAHRIVPAGHAASARLRLAPVWLVDDARRVERHEALVNLGADVPPGFETFARLIEIVASDGAERTAARARWKYYADRGYPIKRHEAVS